MAKRWLLWGCGRAPDSGLRRFGVGLDDFVVRPAFCRRYLVRLSSSYLCTTRRLRSPRRTARPMESVCGHDLLARVDTRPPERRHLPWLGMVALLFAGSACGTDAEREYAGLSALRVEPPAAGYVLRYLSPPWQLMKDDPLATGARKSVPIGGENVPVVDDSAAVLEIERESNVEDDDLSFPKYRLEAALVACDAEDPAPEDELPSCAERLAQRDYTARQSDGSFDRFGSEPRPGENDAEQQYFELMGQTTATRRFRRIVFFETAARDEIAAWLLIEANPDLAEPEITELIQAFEVLPGSEDEP
jgi:hypothetical protein